MKGIVIRAKDQNELKFLSNLLRKLGISTAEMSTEELEDLGLAKLLKSVDRDRKVSKASILKKLRS